jgi:thiol-disulfide isomerase/thioredoxin
MLGRRLALMGGVGVMAAAAGAGLAWRQLRPGVGTPEIGMGAAERALWDTEFDTPGGQRLAMKSLLGKPLLLNFWATWCPPCVEEFPLLDGFYRQNASKGWQVLGLAIDQPSAVRGFLQKLPVTFPIALAGLEGTELSRSLGNLAGGLPFSLVLGSTGAVLQRKMGKLNSDDLGQWASLR